MVIFSFRKLANGLGVHFAQRGNRRAPAVLMLHGLSGSWFSYSRILPLLPEGLRIVVPDLRGHGFSSRPRRGYDVRDYARDALELLDALDIEQAAVVGHSLGSFVAREIALIAPERVSRLVLVGSAAQSNSGVFARLLERVERFDDPIGTDFLREFQTSTVRLELPDAFVEELVSESRRIPVRVWKDTLRGLVHLRRTPDLAQIACPTLVMGGELDEVFSYGDQQDLVRRLRFGLARMFPGVGHAPHWETPQAVAADLTRFLPAPYWSHQAQAA